MGLARITERRMRLGASGSEDRFEREKIEFHERVRAGFLELARVEPARFRVVDASRGEKDVAQDIRSIIDSEVL
jgi:dTMP kinase